MTIKYPNTRQEEGSNFPIQEVTSSKEKFFISDFEGHDDHFHLLMQGKNKQQPSIEGRRSLNLMRKEVNIYISLQENTIFNPLDQRMIHWKFTVEDFAPKKIRHIDGKHNAVVDCSCRLKMEQQDFYSIEIKLPKPRLQYCNML